jgi:hypothetical protein
LNSNPNPFGLSLSKPSPSYLARGKEEKPFDKLRANGRFDLN